jgi:uncharacterized protein (UPF0248 family)
LLHGGTVLRDLFNERKWKDGDLSGLAVDIVHRGAPGDQRTVFGADILEIRPGGLLVRVEPDEAEPDDTAFIPYHRVLVVRDRDEAVLWERRGRED